MDGTRTESRPMRRRDRTPPSIWLEVAPETVYAPLRGAHEAQVAIVGAGITGLIAAWLARQAGYSVALIEAETVCSGVTAYTTAKLSALQDAPYADIADTHGAEAAALYAQANRAAIARIRRLVAELEIDCDLEAWPAFVYTREPGRVEGLRAQAEAARRAGLAVSFTGDVRLPFPVEGAIRAEDEAAFHPRRFCLGLARAFTAAGGRLFEGSRVVDVDDGAERVEVKTADGVVRAERVLLATQIPFLDRGGFFAKTSPQRSYGLAFALDGPAAPPGLFLTRDGETRSLRPLPGRRALVVGGENHKTGHEPDTGARYAALEEFARAHFPVESRLARWSAHDYTPVDGLPYIGRLPRGSARIQVATGFRKWGLTLGAAAAAMFVEHLGGEAAPWAALFDATRVDVLGSAKSFVSENLDVGKRFFGDRLRHAVAADGPETLAPGEGGIVRVDGRAVGGFRDEAGTLHTVSLVCTHLGCHLTWNNGDRTWDCPCHGSRFGYDGVLVQGPALRDLDRPGEG